MKNEHRYGARIRWTGNTGKGTDGYFNYERNHSIEIKNKPVLLGSSDPSFRGDPKKHNPEELLVASISACHMLWYLHLCSQAGVIVLEYADAASGTMVETANDSGYFKEVVLNPTVKVSDLSMVEKATEMHHKANEFCYIANSLNFKVKHNPETTV